jgi:hypothetical protein
MTLIKYKNPTEYCFYKWIMSYPKSEYWAELIRKNPSIKLCPLLETVEFYRFVKTACKNQAVNFLKWENIENAVLKEIPILSRRDLKELKNICNHLVSFYKAPGLKKGFNVENISNVKKGCYTERGFENGKFYEKEVFINEHAGGVFVYDKQDKKYKKLF